MSTAELDAMFDRHVVVINGMLHRGGIQTKRDADIVEGFINELEQYDGKKTLVERYLIWHSVRILKGIVDKISVSTE